MQGNKSNCFFEQKLVTLIILMWTKLLDIFYVFKGKCSNMSVKAVLKGYCCSFPYGSRRDTSRCLPLSSHDVSLPHDCWLRCFASGFQVHCHRTPDHKVHCSRLPDGGMASPCPEAVATFLPHWACTLWALHAGTH